jgi:DNA-binding CsgD family transcriptional regulator/PAS domain-containing protein
MTERQLHSVVNGLYEAVAHPTAWPAAMDALADLLRSDHAMLWMGAGPVSQADLVATRIDHEEFTRRQVAYDACAPQFAEWLPLGAVTRDALVADRDYERDSHYNEVVRHVGGFHALFARARKPGAAFRLAACRHRNQGNFDSDDLARLERLMPHLANVSSLHIRLGMAEAQETALVGLLDRLSTALVLVDPSGRPVFANRAAERIAGSGDIELRRDGLAAATAADTRSLREAIAAVSMEPAAPGRCVCLGRATGRLPLLATVLPFAELDVALPGCPAPRAAVFISEPERADAIDRQALSKLFGLTPRESDVAVLLAQGMSLDRIAERLDLGRGTVGSHLKRAFDKTDTHSQAALAALVGRITRPAN